jgi:phosphinothricin acetyltransferase
MEFNIDTMHRKDWVQVRTIYGQGLATGIAAFMSVPPVWKDWDAGHMTLGRIVARDDAGHVLGWTALAPVPDT